MPEKAPTAVEAMFPGVLREGAIDRDRLSKFVLTDPAALQRLEGLVHPAVAEAEARFVEKAAADGRRLTHPGRAAAARDGRRAESRSRPRRERSATPSSATARCGAKGSARPGSRRCLTRQMADAEKRRKAHFVIDTGGSLDETRRAGEPVPARCGRARGEETAACVKSCWIPRRPASVPRTDTGCWRSARWRSSTSARPAPSFMRSSTRSATCRKTRSGCMATLLIFSGTNPSSPRVVDEFLAFVGDARLVIHNAEFDLGFLNAELARLGRDRFRTDRVVDTLALARSKHPGQPNSLDALCDRYRVDRSRRVKHGALLDAEILVEIYLELTGGRQRSLSFEDEVIKAMPSMAVPHLWAEPRMPRASLIEAGEEAAHKAYVRSLGKSAIWIRYLTGRARKSVRIRRFVVAESRLRPGAASRAHGNRSDRYKEAGMTRRGPHRR